MSLEIFELTGIVNDVVVLLGQNYFAGDQRAHTCWSKPVDTYN